MPILNEAMIEKLQKVIWEASQGNLVIPAKEARAALESIIPDVVEKIALDFDEAAAQGNLGAHVFFTRAADYIRALAKE